MNRVIERQEQMVIKAISTVFLVFGLTNMAQAQQPLPNFREPAPGQSLQYRSSNGTFLGESVNRNGVTTHRNSSGKTIYITRCSGRNCVMTERSGRIVQTWRRD
jgi:hypothetical protein